MLSIAANWLVQEKKDITAAKEAYMAETCPKPSLSGDQAALMEACKKLHAMLDKIDEERYDAESKVGKADKEIEDLRIKVVDLAGVKKPALKKVRMSADAMLKALLGSKHTVNMDLRANLKQVKKEVKEEPAEAAGDWRKNIEDKADRKKMGKRMTSSRRHHLKSLILQIAADWLEQEVKEAEEAKEAYMSQNCPSLDLSGDQAALVELCKKLHQAIDTIDEERYDSEAKVQKSDKEISDLKLKIVELGGVKKPALKKVRMSADAMLQALLGGKHKVTMDLRSNLKQVKKEVKEEAVEAGDWRKNIEDKADRKKMFETS
ncbi:Troponin I, fast skeletal muscle [Merluccius polli]|uniref:Troponin I, fast skeletal muscle n=1 Tax=Merluccius polli TaxID=89951 RepID=A0AA47N435_MERPO|nr:Troponin I, fast skeletal muscle [Merluccius polli]